jgi:hypothetical protein
LITRKQTSVIAQAPEVRPAVKLGSNAPENAAQAVVPTDPKNMVKLFGPGLERKADQRPVEDTPAQPIERSDDTVIVRKHRPHPSNTRDTDFWHIQPEEGPTAAEAARIAREKAASRGELEFSDDKALTPKDRDYRVRNVMTAQNPYTPDRYERVQVGDVVTTIKTAYRVDEEGRKKSIHIDIGTSQERP